MRRLFVPWILVNRVGIAELFKGEKLNGYDFELGKEEKLGLLVEWSVGTDCVRPSAYICDDVQDLRTLVKREESKGRNLEFTVYKVNEKGLKGLCYTSASESL